MNTNSAVNVPQGLKRAWTQGREIIANNKIEDYSDMPTNEDYFLATSQNADGILDTTMINEQKCYSQNS